MMSLCKKKKGVTLIELVIALGLLAIVTSFIFSFFFSNERKLDEINIRSDLQNESKVILDTISKYAMEASKCKIEKNLDDTIKSIIFSKVDDNGLVISEGAKFIIEDSNIYLSTQEDEKKMIGSHVEQVEISNNTSRNIEVRLLLQEKGKNYSVRESFLFRNSHKE